MAAARYLRMYLRQRKHDFRAKSSKTLRERGDSEDDEEGEKMQKETKKFQVVATKTQSPLFRDLSRCVPGRCVPIILVKTIV